MDLRARLSVVTKRHDYGFLMWTLKRTKSPSSIYIIIGTMKKKDLPTVIKVLSNNVGIEETLLSLESTRGSLSFSILTVISISALVVLKSSLIALLKILKFGIIQLPI